MKSFNVSRLKRLSLCLVSGIMSLSIAAQAQHKNQDLLVKLAPGFTNVEIPGAKIERITDSWVRVQTKHFNQSNLTTNPAVEFIQPNYKIVLPEEYKIQDMLLRAALTKLHQRHGSTSELVSENLAAKDNPPFVDMRQQIEGADPLFNKQWGLLNIGVEEAWKVTRGNPDMIVAVLDTGVDYTHEDLIHNLWKNTKEVPDNGLDDDGNGYIDDIIGWDFASNDNKPYDLAMAPMEVLFKGGNPGHGTHCAGNVAARGNNNVGISGVAPNVKIMALRFMNEKGQGTTADAIKAIKYAVDNGAKIISNSWGSEGEDPDQGAENQALRDVIKYAQDHNVLFVAAAGNGHEGKGYSNDTDAKPSYPASYTNENIISVAAMNAQEKLGPFSNWGQKTVHIAAPGVQIFSTTVGNNYSDTIIDKYGFKVTWDGTSMACPIVAGAAALYWSAHPEQNYAQVKAAIIGSARKSQELSDKTVSGGSLDVEALLKF